MYFLTYSSLWLVKKDFLSRRNSIFLFRVLLKLLKFGGGKSCLWKLIFRLVELFFLHFSDFSITPSSESYFPSSGNVFLNESSNPYGGGVFTVLWKPFSLIYNLFLQVESVPETNGNPFFGGKNLFLYSS